MPLTVPDRGWARVLPGIIDGVGAIRVPVVGGRYIVVDTVQLVRRRDQHELRFNGNKDRPCRLS